MKTHITALNSVQCHESRFDYRISYLTELSIWSNKHILKCLCGGNICFYLLYDTTQLTWINLPHNTFPTYIVTKVYFSFAVHFRGMSLKGCSDVFSSFLWFSFLPFHRFISAWRKNAEDMTKAQFCKVILWTNHRANRQEAKSWKKPTEDHNQH